MTSSPDPRRDEPLGGSPRDRRRLTSDELIAMFVAFLSIGGILAWGLTRTDTGFDLGSLSNSLFATAKPGTSPTVAPTASPDATGNLTAPLTTAPAAPNANLSQPDVQAAPPSPQAPILLPFLSGAAPETTAASPSPSPTLPTLTPAPATPPPPPRPNATSPTGFSDVPADYWASAYIAELVRRNIIGGFPDGTYQPNKPITRAEFAGIVGKAFEKPKVKQTLPFKDLAGDYWAKGSIDEAVQTGFMNGYPGEVFQPDQQIPLIQLQTALVTGLGLKPQGDEEQVLTKYQDANQLPKWARQKAAIAAESGLVTEYPSPQRLEPNRVATRADAAALIYKAMVQDGRITRP